MSDEATKKPELKLVPEEKGGEEATTPIAKPEAAFDLNKFKSKQKPTIPDVETLQTALPDHSIRPLGKRRGSRTIRSMRLATQKHSPILSGRRNH
jgi:cytochrome c556